MTLRNQLERLVCTMYVQCYLIYLQTIDKHNLCYALGVRYFPVELDVAGREVLVVGATGEVVPKIGRLLDAGARVVVIAAGQVDAQVAQWVAEGRVKLEQREAQLEDVDGKALVFVATIDADRAPIFYKRALDEGRLLCTVDRPELSTFVNPAVVRASGLTMTFASGGTAPGAMRRIREDLEALFSDPRFATFLDALGRLRARLPRGQRAEKMAEAVRGFGIDAVLRFPSWLDDGDPS
jgi:precorrin-2 dehydrogenase / sirohydrochlorin ferrochelatase